MPVDRLFPTLPPASYIPAFDLQVLSTSPVLVGDTPPPNAFFMVVIDGPPGAVTNLNKRDGSHIEFLTPGMHLGQDRQTAQFVCMDDSEHSNCNDIHLDGVEGTIIRLPDEQGFATWAVAHAITPLATGVPEHLRKRSPPNATVFELEYSYDFSLSKRDAGPIYIRVDYSDSHDYFEDVVAAKPDRSITKRDAESTDHLSRRWFAHPLAQWKASES